MVENRKWIPSTEYKSSVITKKSDNSGGIDEGLDNIPNESNGNKKRSHYLNNNNHPHNMSLHQKQSFANNMYTSGIPGNLRRDRSDIYNPLNDIDITQFDQRMSINRNHRVNTATSGQPSIHDLQQENRRLHQQIAECQRMLKAQMAQIPSAGTMGINHVNIMDDNMDSQMIVLIQSLQSRNPHNRYSPYHHRLRLNYNSICPNCNNIHSD